MGSKNKYPHHIDEGDIFVDLSKHWHEKNEEITPHISEEDVFIALSMGNAKKGEDSSAAQNVKQ